MDALGVICTGMVVLLVFASAYGLLAETEWRSLGRRLLHLIQTLPRAGPTRIGGLVKRSQFRREQVVRDMPLFLDIVTLGLSAGLSFDASLELYCSRYGTRLAQLVSDALLSWRIGVSSRTDALMALAREVDAAAMERFATTVCEALAFGTPLSDALERQAQTIRDEQRAQIEEEIERVPVKMLIPMGVLIVPAMLLAILGPLLGPALGMA